MKRSVSYLCILSFCGFVGAVAPASAANTLGGDCSVLGTTQMSDDRTGIIGCFLVTGTTGTPPSCTNAPSVTNGNCKWKSTTGGSTGIGACYSVHAARGYCFGSACQPYVLTAFSGFSGGVAPGDIVTAGAVNGYNVGLSPLMNFQATCKSGYTLTSCNGIDDAITSGGHYTAGLAIPKNNGCYIGESSQSNSGEGAWTGTTSLVITCCKNGS